LENVVFIIPGKQTSQKILKNITLRQEREGKREHKSSLNKNE
jgi:hypothetical protein